MIRFRVAWDKGANPPCWVVAAVNESDRSSGFVGPVPFKVSKGVIIANGAHFGVQSNEIEFI